MDIAQAEESPSQPKENLKRKPLKDSPFTVIRELDTKKQTFSLKMVKPSLPSKVDAGEVVYPTVCLKQETAGNEHAFHIMHDLHHKNILSMKVLCKNKAQQSNDSSSLAAFVEPYEGLLWTKCTHDKCADKIQHIPSREFQSYLRQIVIGLDFLRNNGLYHGNLSWDSTLYHEETVKLAGFISKETMSKEEAQWDDWLSFVGMIETVADRAANLNQSLPEKSRYFYANLSSLVIMLKALDRTSLPTVKDSVLEHIFFWNLKDRIKFFANSVSLKLSDGNFLERVRNSGICEKAWDTNCTIDFKDLVKKMNEYRESRRKKGCTDQYLDAYDGESLEDYVKCICGAYTHSRQINLDVDCIIRQNHPMICGAMKIIFDAPDN